MKTFNDFLHKKEQEHLDENAGAILRTIGSALGKGKDLIKGGAKLAGGIGTGVATGVAADAISNALFGSADNPEEAAALLKSKFEEAEKNLKTQMETLFKTFSTNLSKLVTTMSNDFKRKLDTSIQDFMK